jgi:hypothetical protein
LRFYGVYGRRIHRRTEGREEQGVSVVGEEGRGIEVPVVGRRKRERTEREREFNQKGIG